LKKKEPKKIFDCTFILLKKKESKKTFDCTILSLYKRKNQRKRFFFCFFSFKKEEVNSFVSFLLRKEKGEPHASGIERFLDEEGKLKQLPSKKAVRDLAYAYLAEKILV
jgi:predicted CopG family antitoxin